MALRISAEVTLQGTDAYGFALKQIGLTRRDFRVQSRARLGAGVRNAGPGAQPGTALQPPAVARYEVETPSHRPDAAQSDREARRVAGVGGYVTWPIRVDSLVQALRRVEARP